MTPPPVSRIFGKMTNFYMYTSHDGFCLTKKYQIHNLFDNRKTICRLLTSSGPIFILYMLVCEIVCRFMKEKLSEICIYFSSSWFFIILFLLTLWRFWYIFCTFDFSIGFHFRISKPISKN
jgi:hypothetical protein